MATDELDDKRIPVELKEKVLSLPPSQLTHEEKRLRRIFRNRASAERSRKRMLKLLEELEEEYLSLKKKVESLQSVKVENAKLKQQLKDLDSSLEDLATGVFTF
ncbi:hypothetical protein GpartN1_g1509.t1 [Galdieria partita]|uniref:BZIP domain-containing protein n=1 Tax=Galdieria partita TaxID=83374 RepID=A0A9C7PRU0_9RHOD|nr:hypothetical protein GpartN1_g462.t1 [Galdieria partita]GJQ09718.1 hypothetical protein GpartN1_g1509.t1 [Galdieria partita]